MTREDAIKLVRSSRTPREMRKNCRLVKKAHGGGYPDYWFEVFIKSGLLDQVESEFQGPRWRRSDRA